MYIWQNKFTILICHNLKTEALQVIYKWVKPLLIIPLHFANSQSSVYISAQNHRTNMSAFVNIKH